MLHHESPVLIGACVITVAMVRLVLSQPPKPTLLTLWKCSERSSVSCETMGRCG